MGSEMCIRDSVHTPGRGKDVEGLRRYSRDINAGISDIPDRVGLGWGLV